METRIEYVKDAYYCTRGGRKAKCVHVWPTVWAVFVCDEVSEMGAWMVNGGGRYRCETPTKWDIIGPWRDPAQVRVVMYRNHVTGAVRAWDEVAMSGFPPMDGWDMIGDWTLTEGAGNVPA